MTSFVVKGWLLGAARISSAFSKMCAEYPQCTLSFRIDGEEAPINKISLMSLLMVLQKIENRQLGVLQVFVDGEGERELAFKMASFLWNFDKGSNMFMVVMPSKSLDKTLFGESTFYEYEEEDWLECAKLYTEKYIEEYTTFTHS